MLRILSILFILSALLPACAHRKLATPSPMGVTAGIARVQSGVTTAQAGNSQIAQKNVEARSNLQRADNKDMIIDAYKKWKATHP